MDEKDIEYLKHIKDEIEFLSEHCDNISVNGLIGDIVLQRASIRSLEVIGEAVKNLSEDYKQQNSSIEWKKIAGFRDILIHHYFGIDWQVVRDVINNKIPKLEKIVNASLEEIQNE